MAKNKITIPRGSVSKIQKIIHRLSEDRPNIYAFLVSKGISDKIAEDAQEFIGNCWTLRSEKIAWAALNYSKEFDEALNRVILELDGLIEDFSSKFSH